MQQAESDQRRTESARHQSGDRESELPAPGLLDVAKSVGAAFFGVQSEANRRRDFTRGRALHFVVVGAAATVLFVVVLIVIVRVVLAQAGV